MPDKTPLSGSSAPIEIAAGGYALQAPGWIGEVEEMRPTEHATRGGSGHREEALLTALEDADMHAGKVFEIEIKSDRRPVTDEDATRADGLTATTREGEPAILFRMPRLGETVDHAVLYSDEAGGSRWVFPERQEKENVEVVFHLPRNSPQPQLPEGEESDQATRGPISKLGRRLVRVVAWATDPLIGKAARAIARAWEKKKRPYGFHAVRSGAIGPDVSWDLLRQGRALLLVHGTFSSAQAGFASFVTSPTFDALAAHYGQRVFAFNHPSLHCDPSDNVQIFFEQLPDGVALDIDIVTHSRGGLIGRELMHQLAERQRPDIHLKRAVLVAAPNQGTVLARGESWFDLIDRYTNLLTKLPDNVYTLVMEGVLALVRLVARGSVKGLPGLNAMLPDGAYLKDLNGMSKPQTRLYAIAADFTPSDPGLIARFGKGLADAFVDRVFGESNDGVVPTLGMTATGTTAAGFPIPEKRRRLFELDVHHLNYFASEDVNQQMYEWLTEDRFVS